MSIVEAFQIGSTLVAAAALLLNFWQLRKNGLQKRAEHLTGLFAKFQEDPDTVEMFRRVDHDEIIFQGGVFPKKKDETNLDKLLFTFERIATVHEMGAVPEQDLDFMAYEFIRITDNKSVQEYFIWLDKWFDTRGMAEICYPAMRRVSTAIEKNHKERRRINDCSGRPISSGYHRLFHRRPLSVVIALVKHANELAALRQSRRVETPRGVVDERVLQQCEADEAPGSELVSLVAPPAVPGTSGGVGGDGAAR